MRGRLVERGLLSRRERTSMCSLLMQHYRGVSAEVFEADLSDKDYVILLHDEAERLVGFTTFAIERVILDDEPLRVLYSGDTIVSPEARRSSVLSRTWIDSVRQIRAGFEGERLVWLLICSGPRTYRFLPVFWREFFPRFDRATPPSVSRHMRTLAERRYGACLDAEAGVVRLTHPQPLVDLESNSRRVAVDEHVACFHEHNPGHENGDELVCYAELSDDNLTRAGWRMVRAGERAREAAAEVDRLARVAV